VRRGGGAQRVRSFAFNATFIIKQHERQSAGQTEQATEWKPWAADQQEQEQ